MVDDTIKNDTIQNDNDAASITPATSEAAVGDARPAKKATKAAAKKAAARPAKKAAAEGDAAPAKAAKASRTGGAKTAKVAKTAKAAKVTKAADADPAGRSDADTAATPTPTSADASAPADSSGEAPARTPRKRASRKSAAPDGPTEGSAPSAEQGGSAPAPSFDFAMPLFQAPEAVPQRRSRRATAAASAPGSDTRPDDDGAAQDTASEASPEASERSGAGSDDERSDAPRKRRRRGGRGRRPRADGEGSETDGMSAAAGEAGESNGDERGGADADADETSSESTSSRRRRRRRRSGGGGDSDVPDEPNTVVRVRESRRSGNDEITGVRGSTRLEAKKQRRREGREAGRRKQVITEAEFLARRESVERVMVVRQTGGRTQIGVLEDDVLVEHYVSREANASMAGNVYLGRVQNVLPSMEAAFVDIGKGRNAVLYAGEVNWDAAGLEGQAKRIENVLKSGESVLVQVTKDPIGHKGARLTSQISLPGRYLVYVPEGSMTGISRKLPDTERTRLKSILKAVLPEGAGVIVRTAAEGASEEELRRDVERLAAQWEAIKAGATTASAPALLHGEPDLTVRVIRDIFNEDFAGLVVSGDDAWTTVSSYVGQVAPDLTPRVSKWTGEGDAFTHYRIDEQLAKALDRKVWLPSGGSLVIDRTEAMTVIDVNTGKFTGSGGNLEETVTKNNIEAAEEIVRQLRLRDIGGIVVVDFIDMVLESNRDLVLRRLMECLGRDRTKHQVAEVTSLGLVQMTRKRVGQGLLEVFSETCEVCHGRGIIVHTEPVEKKSPSEQPPSTRSGRGRGRGQSQPEPQPVRSGPSAAEIAARAHAAALHTNGPGGGEDDSAGPPDDVEPVIAAAERLEDRPEEHLEPETSVTGAPGRSDAPVEAASSQEPQGVQVVPAAEQAESAAEPALTGRAARRRRGRVTAPAGPPPPHIEAAES